MSRDYWLTLIKVVKKIPVPKKQKNQKYLSGMLTAKQQKIAETAVALKACSAQDMDVVDVLGKAQLQFCSGRFLKIAHVCSDEGGFGKAF